MRDLAALHRQRRRCRSLAAAGGVVVAVRDRGGRRYDRPGPDVPHRRESVRRWRRRSSFPFSPSRWDPQRGSVRGSNRPPSTPSHPAPSPLYIVPHAARCSL